MNYHVGSRYWGDDGDHLENHRERQFDYRTGRQRNQDAENDKKSKEEDPVRKPAKDIDPVLTRTGGAYTPPAKLRMMQAQLTDKSIKV